MTLLSDDEVAQGLQGSDWRRDGDEIVRDLKFDDFAGAMAFVNDVAAAAEEANHHPDIRVHGWNNVELRLSTHSEGGLTASDLEHGARRLTALTRPGRRTWDAGTVRRVAFMPDDLPRSSGRHAAPRR